MNEEEYLKERLEGEIRWYSSNSTANKNRYQYLKTAEIIISVIIPFLTGYLKENESIKYVIGILGCMVAVIAGLLVLYKYQEKWIEYRTTTESLKHEKFMYLSGSGPYKTDPSLANLVERVEYLIAKENSNWNQMISRTEDALKPAESKKTEK
ncbi:MAG: DUF4231 domain-containing protein [Chitinophagales bacterium]